MTRARRLALFAALLFAGCRPAPPQDAAIALPALPARFGDRVALGRLACDAIDEASGLVASRSQSGVLWTQNDSGDLPRVFALDRHGAHLGVFLLEGAAARDWEDIALGPGPEPGRDYLYAADCGDNEARYDVKTIYRVAEPRLEPGDGPVERALGGVDAIRYRYPDGPRDAETILVDPLTRDIVIVSKRERAVHVYRAAWPQPLDAVITLEAMGELPLGGVTAGDISADGREILIKTYNTVHLWTRAPGEALAAVFARKSRQLPYFPEPQGEAIAWDPATGGFYTLSEERDAIPAVLYFYPRLAAATD